ncbi:MAG TPA: hypothetical protein VF185_02765 [Patescibacteria group bacterium]
MEIIPAILTNNPSELADLVKIAEGKSARIQIDIIDGNFADNKTIDPSILSTIDTDLLLDFHLMTKDPIDWVEKAATGQADRIIGQIEKMSNQLEFIAKVEGTGSKVGLALDLATPIGSITPQTLTSIDVILVMSVPAGFAGQKFDTKVFDKLEGLYKLREKGNFKFRICVDGGVTPSVVKDLVDLHVDEIVVGKRLFEGDLEENIKKFILP